MTVFPISLILIESMIISGIIDNVQNKVNYKKK